MSGIMRKKEQQVPIHLNILAEYYALKQKFKETRFFHHLLKLLLHLSYSSLIQTSSSRKDQFKRHDKIKYYQKKKTAIIRNSFNEFRFLLEFLWKKKKTRLDLETPIISFLGGTKSQAIIVVKLSGNVIRYQIRFQTFARIPLNLQTNERNLKMSTNNIKVNEIYPLIRNYTLRMSTNLPSGHKNTLE